MRTDRVIHPNERGRPPRRRRSRRIGALACALGLGLGAGACDGGSRGAASREAQTERRVEEATEGVADDGTPIVFAGPVSARASSVSGSQASGYDEDELIREPNVPDPEEGDFTLEEAVVGMPIDGSLVAEIRTEMGALLCDLYADRAPETVANFVGLARGRRPWWDARAGEWVTRPYYHGLIFHRVIPGFMIQGGDYLGDGTGSVGYTIDDEPHDTLAHDRAGQLAMANREGADSAGAQFFISDGPAPQLDGQGFTIFGQCRPTHVVSQIARVPQNPDAGNRPLTPIHMERVAIRRVEGGAAQAQRSAPRLPEGEPEVPRGASRDPSSGGGRYDPRQYGEPSPMPPGRTGPPMPPRPQRHGGHAH